MRFALPLRFPRELLLGALLFLGAFVLGLTALADGDIWWHLAAGREMVHTRSLLHSDPFSVSAAGRPWIDVHWLFQLAAYGVHQLGGVFALVIAKSLLLATGATLLFATLWRAGARRALLAFVLALLSSLFCVREQLQLRPLIPTLLFLSLFFYELERFRRKRSSRVIWTLPVLELVWANVQGLFVLGLGLVSAYLVGAAAYAAFGSRRWFPFAAEFDDQAPSAGFLRRLALVLSLCLAACAFTPFGMQALTLPSQLLARLFPLGGNVFSANVAENVPPFASGQLLPGQFAHLQWYFGFLCISLLSARRRLRLSHVLIVSALSGLALLANRNVTLLYWLATPIAVLWLAPSLRRVGYWLFSRRWLHPARALGYGVLVLLLGLVGSAAARESDLRSPAPFRIPRQSAERIAQGAAGGSIFAADNYGGYLIWRLFPEHRPYLDTRLILRTNAEYAEYLAVVDEPSRFDAFQSRHGFEYVALPTAYPERYLGLIAHLYHSPEWKLIYTDGSEVLFALRSRSSERAWDLALRSTTKRILASITREFAESPALRDAARVQLATLEVALAEFDEAEQALTGVERPEAQALLARCRLAQGDPQGARRISLRLLANDSGDVQSLNLLALLSLERGEAREAARFVRRALSVDPFDVEAERILSSMEDQRHVESP